MLFEIKIREKTIQKTEWILEGIFDGFWFHFGIDLRDKRIQKSMPKLNEKKDAIWIGFWRMSGQAGGHRDGSSTDLRSDQEQEFQEGV